ncbi:hypothetical protein LDM01_005155, partial [Salmonella enterica subsp. enterica serovar Java]|nr:hypothetical protein [Salmonella enterica subsp. enterica serovar Java]
MAVENKFKLNVIAASVLMGLSLSSVAAEVSTGATTPVADSSASAGASATRPAPATLADKAGVADISKINVTVDSASKPLSEVLQGVDGSTLTSGATDTSKKKTYDDAVLKMGEAQKKVDALSQSDKDKIKTYETSGMSLKNAQSGMNDFITKATGVDKVYREKLNALYGTTDGEFKINESEKSIAPNVVSGSAFAAYSDSAIKGLGTTLTALGVEAYKDAGGESVAAAKTAHDAITTLIGFIYDSEKVALEKQEIAASENYIAEKLPAFLQVIERHKDEKANLGDKKTPKLREHYDAYISAVDAFRKATGDDVATKKTAVYTALQALVEDVNGSGSAVASLSSGDKTVVSKFKTSLEAVKTITDKVNGTLTSSMNSIKDGVTVGDKKITTEQEALTQLKTSFDALLDAANTKLKDDKNTADQKKLQEAVDKATNSYRTFTAARDKYNTLHQEVTDAGNARLSLSTEWQNVDKSYADAWKAYNEAKNEYDSLTDVSSLATAEADVASKRGEYIKSLSEASAATDGAITAAGKAYADAIKATGVTQAQKNAALYTLIGQKKALVPVKLRLDKEALELAELGYTGSDKSVQSLKALQDSLAAAEAGKADAEQKYNAAVTEYLAAQKKLGADKTVANEVAASVAGEQLKHAAGVSDVSSLYNTSGDASGGFVTFDKLP